MAPSLNAHLAYYYSTLSMPRPVTIEKVGQAWVRVRQRRIKHHPLQY